MASRKGSQPRTSPREYRLTSGGGRSGVGGRNGPRGSLRGIGRRHHHWHFHARSDARRDAEPAGRSHGRCALHLERRSATARIRSAAFQNGNALPVERPLDRSFEMRTPGGRRTRAPFFVPLGDRAVLRGRHLHPEPLVRPDVPRGTIALLDHLHRGGDPRNHSREPRQVADVFRQDRGHRPPLLPLDRGQGGALRR